ncbi:MAG: hypothetical protein L0241_22530 [Planctomycetia bacterium]|nr:hypothetical protein [Planctomycetia bacterium]
MSDVKPADLNLKLPPALEALLTPSTQGIDWARMMLSTEISFIRDYIETTAEAFDAAFDAFDAKVAEEAAKLPEDMRYDLYDDESMRAFNLKEYFPAFSWLTTFASIYSFLEDEMLGVATTVGRQLGIKLRPDDLRHNGIFAAQVYLRDLCGIDFPEESRPWQEVRHYNHIRNAIVHSRGNLFRAKKAKDIEKYAEGKKSIVIENDHIELSKEFCLEALENVRALLDEVTELARERIVAHEAGKPKCAPA